MKAFFSSIRILRREWALRHAKLPRCLVNVLCLYDTQTPSYSFWWLVPVERLDSPLFALKLNLGKGWRNMNTIGVVGNMVDVIDGGYERNGHLFFFVCQSWDWFISFAGLIPPLVVLKLISPRMDQPVSMHRLLSLLVWSRWFDAITIRTPRHQSTPR